MVSPNHRQVMPFETLWGIQNTSQELVDVMQALEEPCSVLVRHLGVEWPNDLYSLLLLNPAVSIKNRLY